jgi:WD40 repeat protein
MALIRLAATLLNCRFDDLRQRDQERHQQQMVRYLAAAVVSVFVLIGLSIYAWMQRDAAVTAGKEAFSRELAANAVLLPKEDPELNLRLALNAWRVAPTEQAEFSLRNAMVDYNDSHLRAVFEHPSSVRWATFDPKGGRIATASEDGNATLWSVDGGQPLRRFISGAKNEGGYDQIMYQANFSPDGSLLVTANQDGRMRVYRSDTGEKLIDVGAVEPGDKPAALRSAFFSHNGRRILTAGEGGTVAIWDADTGEKLMNLAGARGHSDILYSAVFSPNDELVATASRDGTIRILDARSGELVGKPLTVEPRRPFRTSAFSPPDGKLILGAGESDRAPLWNALTGEGVGGIEGHGELLRWAAFRVRPISS